MFVVQLEFGVCGVGWGEGIQPNILEAGHPIKLLLGEMTLQVCVFIFSFLRLLQARGCYVLCVPWHDLACSLAATGNNVFHAKDLCLLFTRDQ